MFDHDAIERIKAEKKCFMERSKMDNLPPKSSSEENLAIEPLYGPDCLEGWDFLRDVGFPGEYPFTRGPYPGMYRKRLWAMRQYSGFGTPQDTNARWKYLLEHGQKSLSCACDLPTQLGLDSDSPEAEGEVGKVGVAMDSLMDMEILFDGLPMDQLPTSFNMNSIALIILAMFVATAKKKGMAPRALSGTMANDILIEYAARGTWLFPPEPSLRLLVDLIEYCLEEMPKFFPLNIRGCLLRDSGATMAQEVGYAFSCAMTYMERALHRGLDIDQVAPHFSFMFDSGTHFLQEAAKFRAARRLWAKLMKERFNAQNPESMVFRFTSRVGGTNYTSQQAELNFIRGAFGALGAVLGGTQGMLVAGWDELFAIPTEKSARLGLRTQQLISEETDACLSADPLGGSFMVETLTNQLEGAIMDRINEVEAMGGAVRAIESGFIQAKLAEEAYRQQKEEEKGQRVIIGKNKYLIDEEHGMEVHRENLLALREQLERLKELKAQRDNQRVKRALDALKKAAEGRGNLMPSIMEAVEAYATIGEMASALKSIFGLFKETVVI